MRSLRTGNAGEATYFFVLRHFLIEYDGTPCEFGSKIRLHTFGKNPNLAIFVNKR